MEQYLNKDHEINLNNVKKGSNISDFHSLFHPSTVAVIGVSKNLVGGIKYVMALDNSGFIKSGGKVFPINPKYQELYNYKVYPSLEHPDIPESIDMAIIAVPAPQVPEVVRACNKRVKFAIIFTSGFGESGEHQLQKELEKAVKEVDTRIIGPNCLGIMQPYSKLTYYPQFPMPKPGKISYISMSGGTTARLTVMLDSEQIGFNNIVSIGNSIDVQPSELMQYFAKDGVTNCIALYIESIKNGREFFDTAKQITKKIPIILWKGGKGELGKKATVSHTGGLAGDYKIWQSMARQSGIMIADHFEYFHDLVLCATLEIKSVKSKNVGIIVAGGGIGVEFTDMAESLGLNVPELTKETQKKLAEIFQSVNTNFKNPVDLGEYGYVPEYFNKALKIIVEDPNIDSVLFVREPERFDIFSVILKIPDMVKTTIDGIVEVAKQTNKPMFCNLSPNSLNTKAYKDRHNFKIKMLEVGIPVIDYLPNMVRLVADFADYEKYKQK